MTYIVSVGGGLSSTMELPLRVIEQHGRDNVKLVMCELPNEDPDVWRLVKAVEAYTHVKVEMTGDKLTPWDIFFQEKAINPVMSGVRASICSLRLKSQVMAAWVNEHCDPSKDVMCVGITAGEIERMLSIRANWHKAGWKVEAPLSLDPTVTREYLMAKSQRLFGFVPRLYKWDFDHNNCGGACIKAGQYQWVRLLHYLPDVYQWWEENEERFRREINPNIAILRTQIKGKSRPLPLKKLRETWEPKLDGVFPELLDYVISGLSRTRPCFYCSEVA